MHRIGRDVRVDVAGGYRYAVQGSVAGSAVMLADPIFQGLAIALMAGQVAATLLSRLAVPLLYHALARHGRAAELQREGARAAEASLTLHLATVTPLGRTGTTL